MLTYVYVDDGGGEGYDVVGRSGHFVPHDGGSSVGCNIVQFWASVVGFIFFQVLMSFYVTALECRDGLYYSNELHYDIGIWFQPESGGDMVG